MKKIPKLLLVAAMGLLSSTSGCDKKVKPSFEQIDSCKECGFKSESILKGIKVKLNYNSQIEKWIIKGENFSAFLPCKFPKELLKEGQEFIIDCRYEVVPLKSIITYGICIEKIY